MLELLSVCPICSSDKFELFLKAKDYTVSHETFTLQRCTECDFVFTNPRPGINEIEKYYKSEEYISHTNSSKGIQNKLYKIARNRAIKSKIKIVESFNTSPKVLLDYGCGTGEFLNATKKAGWSAFGIEPGESARELSQKNYGLDVRDPSKLAQFETGKFGVITLWHVLEHVHNLKETVVQLNSCLNKNGVLIIAVPNRKSFDAEYYKECWAAYDVPRHLYHFSKDNIGLLMRNAGFEIETIQPLFFDPFYIALLSEKYFGGWSNPFNAALVGLKTTLMGRKNIEANSSLMYVCRKA